jgi:FkbM family methyltransferase
MLPVYLCLSVLLCVSIALGLLLLRLRRNMNHVRGLFARELELERLARSQEIAAIWGTVAAEPKMHQPISFSSQRGEDFHAWHLLGFPREGFFVDVGAYDGIRGSNSYAMEQLGWKGILVEANPKSVEKCVRFRPSSIVVHAAIGGPDARGSIAFHQVSGNTDADMLSFVVSDESHKQMCKKANGTITQIDVPFRSLDSVLSEYAADIPRIDLLSIDIEGIELMALKGLSFERWAPRLIIAEANDEELVVFLKEKGYRRVAAVGANWLFMAESDANSILHKPEFEFYRY